MTIQTQNRKTLYNADNLLSIGILETGLWKICITPKWVNVQTDELGTYSTKERAQTVIDQLAEAFARGAKVFVMPEE